MGEVWKAPDPQLGRDVSIKVSARQFYWRSEREALSMETFARKLCEPEKVDRQPGTQFML